MFFQPMLPTTTTMEILFLSISSLSFPAGQANNDDQVHSAASPLQGEPPALLALRSRLHGLTRMGKCAMYKVSWGT